MRLILCTLLIALATSGCGDPIPAEPGTDIFLNPPQNLAGLSVDSTHVRLSWDASTNASESDFAGYMVSYGTVLDTLPKTALTYLTGPLPSGSTSFSVRSRRTDGRTGEATTIVWAPAYRFDTPLLVQELDLSRPLNVSGVDAGSGTTNPSAVIVNQYVQATLDFYLQGGGGQPLQLRSASLYLSNWNITLFSSVSTPAASLDAPLTAFPSDGTFAQFAVQIADNTIYYARVTGDQGQYNYIRIHVHLLGGTYPDRGIAVRISLQRVAGLPIAQVVPVQGAYPEVTLRGYLG